MILFRNKIFSRHSLFWSLIILFIIVLIFHHPLFQNGFFETDDGTALIIRTGAFFQSFSDFHIPVRMTQNLNFGYGYPIFNFFYPGFFYIAQFFHILGFELLNSIKLSILFVDLIGALGMYIIGKKLTGSNWLAIVPSVVYLYSPYHIIDLYSRGSFGELAALGFAPWVFISLRELLMNKKSIRWGVIFSVSVSFLILSHNSLSIILLPTICLLAVFFDLPKIYDVRRVAKFLFLGLSSSAFFWIPALLERSYTIQPQVKIANFQNHFQSLKSLLYDFPINNGLLLSENKIYPISVTALIIVIITLILFFIDHHHKPWRIKVLLTLLTLGISVFFISPASSPVWSILSLGELVQFPWRFLALTIFCVALLSGLVTAYLKDRKFLLMFLTLFILVYYLPQIKVDKNNNPNEYYLTNDSTTTNQNELASVWFDKTISGRPEKLITSDKNTEIINLKQKTQLITFSTASTADTWITVNKMYFPGWRLKINNDSGKINYENGFINFSLPSGRNNIEISFTDTPIRTISNLTSLLSVCYLGLMLLQEFLQKTKLAKK